ncbi:MAG: glycosyltransferase family 2 protein [Clostridia bacterium]|nr:glycosyltransferase family 2 protein [Clostridia bacterium]
MTVSVALAAYNGEKYIEEQLRSVLPQLSEDDEIVVSVDPGNDGTYEKVKSLSLSDGRVKPIEGKGQGLIKNFENAVKHCGGDIIMLCDQDDVWLPDKVERVKEELSKDGVLLCMHDARVVDEALNVREESFFKLRGTGTGIVKNILKNTYMGCCMAFKSEAKRYILPFPDKLPMHDQWIGLVCERKGKVSLIDEPLILYRRHGDNASSDSHAGALQMLRWRLQMLRALLSLGRKG